MRGEEKRSWWEHGRAGVHFPWEMAALPWAAPQANGSLLTSSQEDMAATAGRPCCVRGWLGRHPLPSQASSPTHALSPLLLKLLPTREENVCLSGSRRSA